VAKLELDYKILDSIFEMDFARHELSIRPNAGGTLRTSMNVQQFYNWYRKKQTRYMYVDNMVDPGGFIGLQPVVIFKSGLKLLVPDVPTFIIQGMIATESPGDYPFIVGTRTKLIMSQYSRPHAFVFLSHSSKDKPFVRELRKSLYSVCDTFFDETDIMPGQSITVRLNIALARTDMLVLLHSEHAACSEWVQREWSSMLYLKRPVVVVRLDDTSIPPLLADLKYIGPGKSAAEVADEIVAALGPMEV
jgi:hypothetical protein